MNKPVILLGNGCRNNPALIRWLLGRGIPVLVTWAAIDLVPEDCPVYCGRPGTLGQRAANIIQQKATHLYCFGARLDGEQVSYNYDRFAPHAQKVVYDIDPAELDKLPVGDDWIKNIIDLSVEVPCLADPVPEWLAWCKELYARFRPELDGQDGGGYVDPHAFMAALSEAAQPDDVLAIGSSSGAVNAFLQSFKVKAGQRVTVLPTIGAMGADIPMALGAAVATGRRVICVTGDGGFQLNAQELATIRALNLPITFFVFENSGYGSIRNMQDVRFEGRHVGADDESGLHIPNIEAMVEGYGIEYRWRIGEIGAGNIGRMISNNGPRVVACFMSREWKHYPRVASTMAGGVYQVDDMQNMTPYLPADELAEIMRWDGGKDEIRTA